MRGAKRHSAECCRCVRCGDSKFSRDKPSWEEIWRFLLIQVQFIWKILKTFRVWLNASANIYQSKLSIWSITRRRTHEKIKENYEAEMREIFIQHFLSASAKLQKNIFALFFRNESAGCSTALFYFFCSLIRLFSVNARFFLPPRTRRKSWQHHANGARGTTSAVAFNFQLNHEFSPFVCSSVE